MSVRLVDNKDTLKKVNDWRDPLYLNNLLTDKEKLIHKKAKDFCKTRLLPAVIDDNDKSFFDKKIYSDLMKYFLNDFGIDSGVPGTTKAPIP